MRLLLHGNLVRLSSFSIVNRQLISGLRQRGHQVASLPSDDPAPPDANPPLPDIYLFNGHPWEARSAPGRLNVFALNYEYLTPDQPLRTLVARLNVGFDLVLVPSAFIQPVLRSAGLRLPTAVVPWGFDAKEFRPGAGAIKLPSAKHFVFLHAAAANERKGLDVLVAAYLAEFSADDDVVLLVKEAPRHATWERWAQRVERRCRGSHAAEVIWMRESSTSLAEYFAKADVGVFPHRGEGFGLPILECIASGRRVIVTAGTGPAAFCTPDNSWSIRTRRVRRHSRVQVEPDVRHLRSLLRRAFEQGRPNQREAVSVARTVAGWTWQRTVEQLEAILRQHLRANRGGARSVATAPYAVSRRTRRPVRRHVRRRPPPSAGLRRTGPECGRLRATGERVSLRRTPAIAYAFHARGTTSWRKLCTEIDRSLDARFAGYQAFTARDRVALGDIDIILGQSEHCLEALLAVRRRNPRALAIVHQECTVLGDRLAIVNRERAHCGVPPIVMSAMDLWRNQKENELADSFIVASSVARACFVANGFDAARIYVVPNGIRNGRFHFRARARTTRFLFVGTDPFRKGIRPLFAAWERAALANAELLCCTDLEVLRSKVLLGYLVRNPSITVRPLLPHRAFLRCYREIDCQVLPSLEDTFSVAVADGMGVGKPAIVSTATGVNDLITHGVDGHVVPAGDVDALAESLRHFAADRQRLRLMGAAAHATAKQYGWDRFRRSIGDLMQSLWDQRR